MGEILLPQIVFAEVHQLQHWPTLHTKAIARENRCDAVNHNFLFPRPPGIRTAKFLRHK